MPRKKPKTLTPKLRFPAFRDAPGWDAKPLKRVAKRIKDRNSDVKQTRVLTNSAEHGIVDQRDYFDKDIANANNLGNYFIVDEGDYVYNPRISNIAPVGPISKNYIGKGVMSPLYTVFRFNGADNEFYAQYFKATHWYQYLRHVSNSGARHDRMSITNDDFMLMPLPSPDPAEQQKIADCLGSLDGWIAAAGRKLAALRDHKRGLLQQLFPQPGQSQPQQRFPEFRKAGKWKQSRLAKLTDELRDGDWIESKDQSDEGIRIVQTGNIGQGVFIPKSGNARFISEDTLRRLNCREVFPGDCLVSRLPDPIGRCCLVPEIGTRMVTAVDCAIIRFNVNRMLPYFFVSYSQTSSYLTEADALGSGSTRKRISRVNLSRITVPIPAIDEQQKIAACLTALDTQITAQASQLDTLHQHKRGLMQQLFPSPEDD